MDLKKSKYEWLAGWVSELEPGEAFRAQKGTDFDCRPQSFASAVYAVAREKQWKATVVCFSDSVVFAFYRPHAYMRPNMPALPIVRKLKGEQA